MAEIGKRWLDAGMPDQFDTGEKAYGLINFSNLEGEE
jgi:hypothetical protein